MADIHSATDEVRRRKKKKKKPQGKNIVSASATKGGHGTKWQKRQHPQKANLQAKKT